MNRLVLLIVALLCPPVLAATVGPSPELLLTTEPDVVRGWPSLIRISLVHPHLLGSEDQRPIRIETTSHTWPESIQLVVTAPDGQPRKWPFVGPKSSEKQLSLYAADRAGVYLRLPAEATAQIEPGQYRLKARLEVREGTGWLGTVESATVELKVAAPPAELSADDFAKRQWRRVQDALAAVDLARGHKEALEWVRAQPKNHRAFVAMALVLDAQGDAMGAQGCANLAISRFAEAHPDQKTPPLELLELRRRLEASTNKLKR